MQYEKNFALMCENYSLDASKKITFFNVFDRFIVESLPAVFQRVYFITNIRVRNITPPDISIKAVLVVKSPLGAEVIKPLPVTLPLEKGKPVQNVGVVVELQNIVFDTPGSYSAEISLNGTPVATIPFDVNKG